MYCNAYCISSELSIRNLESVLGNLYQTKLYRDAIYVSPMNTDAEKGWDLFLFSFGVVVFWNSQEATRTALMNVITPHIVEVLDQFESDIFEHILGDKPAIEGNKIILPNNEILTKLSVSYAYAQSVKLGAFEISLSKTFEKTKPLPTLLAHEGKIDLSRKEIRRRMGELFLLRSSINLQVEVLDCPEFFWDRPNLEIIYMIVAHELDIKDRGQRLNDRLNILKELFEMLGGELDHRHSSRLEWIIIWLIVIEVIISLLEIMQIV